MKVKRLRDGKIVEVEKHGDAIIDENGKVMYFDEVCEVDGPDWQQVRIQAAIAAMQGMMSSEFYCNIKTRNDAAYSKYREKWGVTQITREAVAHADALIAELKKGGKNETAK